MDGVQIDSVEVIIAWDTTTPRHFDANSEFLLDKRQFFSSFFSSFMKKEFVAKL